MADPSQYFVLKSGDVHVVKPENVEEALRRGLKPATEDQRRQYDAVKAAKADPLGRAKAFTQALAEGVTALPGIPAAAMTIVPSLPELVESYAPSGMAEAYRMGLDVLSGAKPEGLPSASEAAKAKRLELAGEMARYTTLPGVQQELRLRTAEEIEAGAKAFPVVSGLGTLGSFFVGPAAQKVLKGVATRAVPALAAEATLGAEARLGSAVARATQVEAKQAAATAAQAELNAAVAGGDAVEIASKQTLLSQAQTAAAAASDDAARLNVALAAESGAVPEELASLVTPEIKTASKAARKAAERMSSERATEVLANLTRGQKNLASDIKRLADVSVSAPAITSKIGTDLAKNVEQRALARLQSAPGFSTKLAEADVALARLADDIAVGEAKVVTGAQLAKAEESLATIRARQEITAKAIGLGLGRSAEMMMFGLQGIANEVALGDPAKVAESAYGVLGFDGTLGAGFGLAEALVPAGLRGGLRVARRTGKRLADALAPVYDDLAAAVTGADVETIRAVRTAGEQLERKTLVQVLEEATPAVPRPDMPPPVAKPVMPKPADFEKIGKELRVALQEDLRQMAAPKEGGLVFDSNTKWRKVAVDKAIRANLQKQTDDLIQSFYESRAGAPLTEADRIMVDSVLPASDKALLESIKSGQFVSTPYRQILKDFIADVREARNIYKSTGMTGEAVPAVQEAAYKVNSIFENLEERFVAFEKSNPTPEKIYEELKDSYQSFFDNKSVAPSRVQLSLLKREVNNAYAGLMSKARSYFLNEQVWGEAAAIEAEIRLNGRQYYAGFNNLKKVAPKLFKTLADPVTGRPTEIVVDSDYLMKLIKSLNSEKSKTVRDALKQYFDGRRAYLGTIDRVAQYTEQNIGKEQIAKRLVETERAFDGAVQTAVDEASNKALRTEMREAVGLQREQRNELVKELNSEYQAAKAERRAYLNEQARLITGSSKGGFFKTGIKVAAKYGGPIIGGLAGGPLGATAGAVYGAVASPVAVSKALAKLNKSLMRASDATSEVSNVLSGKVGGAVRTAEALGSFYSRKEMEKRYKQIEQRTKQLAMDMDAREDQEETMLADLADAAPNVASATRNVNATAIQYLENARPKPPANLPPISLASWTPIEADQRKFVRIAEAVNNPLETLALASKGALLPEQVAALNTVYPSLMEDVRQKLMERIEETGKIPEKHRMMVSMLLGKDVDGRTQLNRMAPTQSVYGTQTPQQQPQLKSYQAKALNPERQAWSDAQPKGAAARMGGQR